MFQVGETPGCSEVACAGALNPQMACEWGLNTLPENWVHRAAESTAALTSQSVLRALRVSIRTTAVPTVHTSGQN